MSFQLCRKKSTIEEIRERFDHDVERFSNLETGQQATIDAPLVLDLASKVVAKALPNANRLLDLGCGAGNFTIKVLQRLPNVDCHLVDLSSAMLKRAEQRVSSVTTGRVQTYQSDLRALSFSDPFDLILAGAVLHHLRDEEDWKTVFRKLHSWLRPGGFLLVWDIAIFDHPAIQEVMWRRFGDYLASIKGPEYRDTVFAYIDKEDSPRSLPFQLRLLADTGFTEFEVLHRNCVFACYYGKR
jgi:tRNA (cmo5U34)-methyltransferase